MIPIVCCGGVDQPDVVNIMIVPQSEGLCLKYSPIAVVISMLTLSPYIHSFLHYWICLCLLVPCEFVHLDALLLLLLICASLVGSRLPGVMTHAGIKRPGDEPLDELLQRRYTTADYKEIRFEVPRRVHRFTVRDREPLDNYD